MAYTDMQEQYQIRQIEHESKMQEPAMTFQAKMEQDRQKFEAEMSALMPLTNDVHNTPLQPSSQALGCSLYMGHPLCAICLSNYQKPAPQLASFE